MSNKYIAGDFPENSSIINAENKLIISWGFDNDNEVDLMRLLKTIDTLTEENKTSILGKAGWDEIGGLALGPLGLLAGVLGDGKQIHIAGELLDGKKFIAAIDMGTYHTMTQAVYHNLNKSIEQIDQEDALALPFYKKRWFMWALMVILFPLGLFFLWQYLKL